MRGTKNSWIDSKASLLWVSGTDFPPSLALRVVIKSASVSM